MHLHRKTKPLNCSHQHNHFSLDLQLLCASFFLFSLMSLGGLESFRLLLLHSFCQRALIALHANYRTLAAEDRKTQSVSRIGAPVLSFFFFPPPAVLLADVFWCTVQLLQFNFFTCFFFFFFWLRILMLLLLRKLSGNELNS